MPKKLWRVPCAGWNIVARTTPTTLAAERELRRFGAIRLDEAALCVEAPTARQAAYLARLRNLPPDGRTEIVERQKVPIVTERRVPGQMTSAEACR